jgi:hypothetical protein
LYLERTDTDARIRVHFALESLPPHLQGSGRPGLFAYFHVVDTGLKAVADAADQWDDDCRSFPAR